MDFIHHQLSTGRRFHCLNIVDDFTRQCMAIAVDTSLGGAAVVAVLERLALILLTQVIQNTEINGDYGESPVTGATFDASRIGIDPLKTLKAP